MVKPVQHQMHFLVCLSILTFKTSEHVHHKTAACYDNGSNAKAGQRL
jgi:hypothetical protein